MGQQSWAFHVSKLTDGNDPLRGAPCSTVFGVKNHSERSHNLLAIRAELCYVHETVIAVCLALGQEMEEAAAAALVGTPLTWH
jgi:hypothetical protein